MAWTGFFGGRGRGRQGAGDECCKILLQLLQAGLQAVDPGVRLVEFALHVAQLPLQLPDLLDAIVQLVLQLPDQLLQLLVLVLQKEREEDPSFLWM